MLTKREMLPEIDMMDVGARQENLAVKGEPIMLQLCAVPAYALTVHKTQVYVSRGACFAFSHDSLHEF